MKNPKPKGGKRPGAGRPKEFVPTKAMRELVRMNLAMRAYTHTALCEVLINPATDEPISPATFGRVFAREIRMARIDVDTIALAGHVRQLKAGNPTSFIWHSKTQWGWAERKGKPVSFELPAINTTSDIVAGLAAITAAAACGDITTDEAQSMASVLELQRKAIEQNDIEERLARLEQKATEL